MEVAKNSLIEEEVTEAVKKDIMYGTHPFQIIRSFRYAYVVMIHRLYHTNMGKEKAYITVGGKWDYNEDDDDYVNKGSRKYGNCQKLL